MPEKIGVIKSSLGNIRIKLFSDFAPKTVKNFIGLSDGSGEWTNLKSGQKSTGVFYSGTIFHRVIPGFMIQGGDPLGSGRGGPGYQFEDEFHPELNFDRPYMLAMANAGPDTNGSQFFITTVPTPHLDGKHVVFGEVIDGFDLIDKLNNIDTNHDDKPMDKIIISNSIIDK